MNVWKKVVTGALVSVAAIAVSAGGGNAVASAATETGTFLDEEGASVAVDYAMDKLHVYTKSSEVMVCVPTMSGASGTGSDTTVKKITEKAYDVYQTTTSYGCTYCEIDLSTLSKKKVSYVMIKTEDYDTPLLVQFNASTQSLKGTYDLTTQQVSFTGKVDGKTVDVSDKSIVYRTTNQSWSENYYYDWEDNNAYSYADLTEYQQTGATLYFRQLGGYLDGSSSSSYYESYEEINTSESTFITLKPTSQTDVSYCMVTGKGVFSSAEVKVKITKRANGPSVTIDYNKRTATVKKGAEWRLGSDGTDDATSSEGWEKVDSASYSVPLDYLVDEDGNAIAGLEVRTSPTFKTTTTTDSDGNTIETKTVKKQASKITRYVVSGYQSTPELYNETTFAYTGVTGESFTLIGETTYTYDEETDTDTKKITNLLAAEVTASKKGVYTGFKLINGDNVSYDYVVSSEIIETTYYDEDCDEEIVIIDQDTLRTMSYKTIKAGKDATIKATSSVQYVYVRYSSIKASKVFSSRYVLAGVVAAKE